VVTGLFILGLYGILEVSGRCLEKVLSWNRTATKIQIKVPSKQSFTIAENVKIKDGKIFIPEMG